MKISMKNRKIGYTYGSVSGHYPFRKEKSIAFESTLERDLIIMLEFNNSVDDIIEQPFTIEYSNRNNRTVTYTPDFLVHFKSSKISQLNLERKPLLIEVKPRKKLIEDWQTLKYKLKQGMKYAKENDMIFKIYDESRIRTQYLSNILFLKRYSRLYYNKDDEDKILSYLNMAGNIPIEHILEYCGVNSEQKNITLSHIWHLLSQKKILCDMNNSLNVNTHIWINTEIEMGIVV